jgi:hypothetical protein
MVPTVPNALAPKVARAGMGRAWDDDRERRRSRRIEAGNIGREYSSLQIDAESGTGYAGGSARSFARRTFAYVHCIRNDWCR